MTVWPSGLRRWLQAPVRKGVGSNPTAVRTVLHIMKHRVHGLASGKSCRPDLTDLPSVLLGITASLDLQGRKHVSYSGGASGTIWLS